MLSESIAKLVQYGITTGLTPECERNYTTNLLLDVFYEDDYTAPEQEFQNIEQLVGGSILSHDHFQGGHYTFAMAKAGIEQHFTMKGFEDVEAGIVKWPMSVIRLTAPQPDRLVDLADRILTAWRGEEQLGTFTIHAPSGEEDVRSW